MKTRQFTVLHVDDDPAEHELMRVAHRLSQAQFRIQSVFSMDEAVQYLNRAGIFSENERFPFPDLVLTDFSMAHGDGERLLLQIRSHSDWNLLRVVMFSGSEFTAPIQRCYEEGLDHFVAKPMTLTGYAAFVKALDECLASLPECDRCPLCLLPGYRPLERIPCPNS